MKIIRLILMLGALALSAGAQSPSFRSFLPSTFATNGYTIGLASNVWYAITNASGDSGSGTFNFNSLTNVPQSVSNLVALSSNRYMGSFVGNGAGVTNLPIWDAYNVANYGADGIYNITKDDAPAFSAAIAAAVAADVWRVYIPDGDYTFQTTVNLPSTGNSAITNTLEIFTDGDRREVIIWAPGMTNKPAFSSANTGSAVGSYKFHDFTIAGPAFIAGRPKYATQASVPYGNAPLIALGSSYAYAGGGLAVIDTELRGLELKGGAYGVGITNGQSILIEECNVWDNVRGNVVLAHVDTARISRGNYGYVLVTNVAEFAYSFLIIGTPGSTWNSPSYYLGGADAGVHKFIEGIEHSGCFLFADSALVTVNGGQFESGGYDPYTPLTNGWCFLTNAGNYVFNSCRINMQEYGGDGSAGTSSTNTVLWHCSGNASAGLRINNCSVQTGIDDTLRSTRPTWFRITGDPDWDVLFHPYWSFGAIGNFSGQSKPTFMNCLYAPNSGGSSYIHIPPMQLGVLQYAAIGNNVLRDGITNSLNTVAGGYGFSTFAKTYLAGGDTVTTDTQIGGAHAVNVNGTRRFYVDNLAVVASVPFTGDGSGLTNIPQQGIVGLTNSLAYLSNNIGGGGGSGISTNGGSGQNNLLTNLTLTMWPTTRNALYITQPPGGTVVSIIQVTNVGLANNLFLDMNANGQLTANGLGITNIPAEGLRFGTTFPQLNAVNLTNLQAANLSGNFLGITNTGGTLWTNLVTANWGRFTNGVLTLGPSGAAANVAINGAIPQILLTNSSVASANSNTVMIPGSISITNGTSYVLGSSGVIFASSGIKVGQISSTLGSIQMSGNNSGTSGYIEWWKNSTTRLGYIGNDTTDVTLNLLNSAKFRVVGGDQINNGSLTATNGVISPQLPWIPTNSVPPYSTLYTNYIMVNLTNTINGGGMHFIATNPTVSGGFILQKINVTQVNWP
jgi:hypothetical protein